MLPPGIHDPCQTQTERWAGSRAPLLVAACTCMIVRWPCCACVLETRSTWDRVFICDLVDLRLAVCRMSRVHPPFSGLFISSLALCLLSSHRQSPQTIILL